MDIRMAESKDFLSTKSAFSEDILRIEIQGPKEVHLTLIDVPGIFRNTTPGLTTEHDIELVRNMVKRYMSNSRTIILAVIPCNVDIASQEILKLAAEADPDGTRTMGVLTKPDLLQEAATKKPVLELLEGTRNPLKLGYCAIANRGADDQGSTEEERLAAEQALFQAPPWVDCSSKNAFGTDALRERLRSLLLEISQRELPNVRAEITAMRRACNNKLMALGAPRADDIAQRQHLVQLAVKMQTVSRNALNAHYPDDLFERRKDLRLITRIVQLNEAFSDTFWKKGHYQQFRETWSSDGEFLLVPEATRQGDAVFYESEDDGESESDEKQHASFDFSVTTRYDELEDIIVPNYECPKPKRGPLNDLIRDMYFASRGPELGTFNGTVLASVFRKVSTKWEPLVLDHVSKAIAIVHDFIFKALSEVCPERAVRDRLWDMVLRDRLCERYQKAMDYARSLLLVERTGYPITLNHGFNSSLQTMRQGRLVAQLEKHAHTVPEYSEDDESFHRGTTMYVPLETLRGLRTDMDNSAHVCDDLLDTVESYYKVARKRFVDIVCQHVVQNMLLIGPDSPLAVLSPETVLQLSNDQLAGIAGEGLVTRSQRETLRRQLESLDEAAKIFVS